MATVKTTRYSWLYSRAIRGGYLMSEHGQGVTFLRHAGQVCALVTKGMGYGITSRMFKKRTIASSSRAY